MYAERVPMDIHRPRKRIVVTMSRSEAIRLVCDLAERLGSTIKESETEPFHDGTLQNEKLTFCVLEDADFLDYVSGIEDRIHPDK